MEKELIMTNMLVASDINSRCSRILNERREALRNRKSSKVND